MGKPDLQREPRKFSQWSGRVTLEAAPAPSTSTTETRAPLDRTKDVNRRKERHREGPTLVALVSGLRGQTLMSRKVVFRHEALPPLAELESANGGRLVPSGAPSFFVSWAWIGNLLPKFPNRGVQCRCAGGPMATRRRWRCSGGQRRRGLPGLIRSRGLYLNETGDPRFNALTIEHNGVLSAAGNECAVIDALCSWFAEARAKPTNCI